jgi:hypothetical protein
MSAKRAFRVRMVKAFISRQDIRRDMPAEQAASDVKAALEVRYPGAVVTCEVMRWGRGRSYVQIDTDEFRRAESIIRTVAGGGTVARHDLEG